MSSPEQYVLGYRREEQERLQQQARDLAHESQSLFDRIGVPAGASVVEIGCGPQGCLELLSACVGPAGRVVGVERSEDAARMARRLIDERGLTNVEVLCGDARSTGLPREAFDLATSRLVLVNVPQPRAIVAEAVALVKPGGSVAFHEADWIAHVCDPPLDAWTKLVDLFVAYSQSAGIDPFIGRKMPRLLREAGLLDVGVNAFVHAYPHGHTRRNILADFADNLTDRLLAGEFISAHELDELKAALRRHLDDPGTLVVSHVYIQTWGRKPAEAGA
jgi:SAM-dependent methyltransferase